MNTALEAKILLWSGAGIKNRRQARSDKVIMQACRAIRGMTINGGSMKKNLISRIIYGALIFTCTVLFSAQASAAEGSVAAQRTATIEKAKSDLVTIREKLNNKMVAQQKAGDKAGARNTQLRILAANNLNNMLNAESGTGGDIYKVNLIEQYSVILNIQDFSGISWREVMNYRLPSPSEMYDSTHISSARVRTGTEQPDGQALEAFEGRALTYASHNTYETMFNGYVRGMGNVAIALNDTFADINPGTAFLEAGLGMKVSGEDIGREMGAGERAFSAGKGVVEVVVDVNVERLMKDTAKSLGTKVGEGKAPKSGGRKSGAADAGEGPSLKGVADDADNTATRANPAVPEGSDKVIGRVDLAGEGTDDITPLLDLENFNIDLRTGEVTRGASFSPKDQAAIEEGFGTGSSSGGTAATAAVPAPGGGTGTEQLIGVVNLSDVNNTMDLVGLTALDNFNIDLRTGEITVMDVGGGRLSPAQQTRIADDFKPQGPIGRDTKIDIEFQGRETEIDIQDSTTIVERNMWGGTYRERPKPPKDEKSRKPLMPKSPWDIFDLMEPGRFPEGTMPEPTAALDVVIYDPFGMPVNATWDLFLPGFENGAAPEIMKKEEEEPQPQGAGIPGEEDDDDPCWGADCIEFGPRNTGPRDVGREAGFSAPGESVQQEKVHPDHHDGHHDFPH